MRRVAAIALVLLGVIAGGAVAPAARATEVGLSDQQASSWSDARLRALGLHDARLIVPWDAATSEPATVQAWLDAVAAAGMEPHVAFEHVRGDDCAEGPCSAPPTVAQYRAAVAAFIARWPQVRTYTTWNEANHSSQPVADRPELVAQYWQQLVAACPGCTVVAGDVLDSGSYGRWLQRFLQAAPTAPQLWGLHDYGDVTYGRTTGIETTLATVPGTVWVEETGGIVTLRDDAGRATLSTDETRAAASIDRAFAIAAAFPRIGRMYLYQWRAGSSTDRFDSGLVRPDGSLRPSYAAVQRGLAALAAAATKAAVAATPAARVTARWSTAKRKTNVLLVRVRCTTATGTRCRGTLTGTIRTRATERAALRSATLKRRTYATTTARTTVTLRIKVGAKTRARVRAGAVRQLRVKLTATLPAAANATTTLTLARH